MIVQLIADSGERDLPFLDAGVPAENESRIFYGASVHRTGVFDILLE